MTWDIQLDTASFGGVPFDVLSIEDNISQRRIAQHKYPYRDGADLDDMGREPRTTRITAIFAGPTYESDLGGLISIVDDGQVATFRHPILGQYQARASITSITHSPDDRDSATVQIEFVEDGTSTVLPTLFSISALEAEVTSWINQISLENVWGYSEISSVVTAATAFVAEAQEVASTIASKINQVRAKIDKAIDAVEELTDVEKYKVVRAMKRCAYSMQKLGVRIQETRPPVAKQQQPVQVPLVVLAQKLYGKDARTRAGELATMNNIRNPLLAEPGELRVYTR